MTLIVAPLEIELRAVRSALVRHGEPDLAVNKRRPATPLVFSRLDVALLRGGHGKAEFAARTAWALAENPVFDRVISVGAAGAIGGDLEAGDIVIATEVVEHDYKERFDVDAPLPRFQTDPALVKVLVDAGAESDRVFQGIVASGDEDVVSPGRAREIARDTQAIAVAWEGAGAARAARLAAVPWCEVRAITDSADTVAARDFKRNLADALGRAATLILGARFDGR